MNDPATSTSSAMVDSSPGTEDPLSLVTPSPAIGPSGFYATKGTADADTSLAAELERELERELIGPYIFSEQQACVRGLRGAGQRRTVRHLI